MVYLALAAPVLVFLIWLNNYRYNRQLYKLAQKLQVDQGWSNLGTSDRLDRVRQGLENQRLSLTTQIADFSLGLEVPATEQNQVQETATKIVRGGLVDSQANSLSVLLLFLHEGGYVSRSHEKRFGSLYMRLIELQSKIRYFEKLEQHFTKCQRAHQHA